jgi:formylglycine-generating enzyme required for sulfatase activity
MQGSEGKPVKLFYSYSHKDEDLRNELADHLFPLQRAGLIEVWHDREMLAGDTVGEAIAGKLRSADLVLVLVSPSFIRSEYCYDKELKNAIERHQRGEARVVPVILRPCQWQLTPLKDLLAMPTDGRAVTAWADKDQALNNVAEAIAKLAKTMRQKGSRAADPAAAGAKPASLSESAVGASTPSAASPHPDPLPLAGEGGARRKSGGRVRAQPKDGVHIGVDPGELPDLAVFKDSHEPWCPEMVVLPAGAFQMGSPPDEERRFDSEGPQHRVTIGKFALGKHAVTFAEYDHFCEVTKRKKPADKGWGRGRQPVINVSWRDAQAYIKWLSADTGRSYRLPTEAEWEYSCRAGTTTPFSVGLTINPSQVNYNGKYIYGQGDKGVYRKKTVPVGSLPANPWGLHEMHGNVREWVEDVWHDDYSGAPNDGTAWTNCQLMNSDRRPVMRGGSWQSYPWTCRSAYRRDADANLVTDFLGFRLARTLS